MHRRFITLFHCLRSALLLGACLFLTGCLGTLVGTAVDVTLEVAKVPFKVAGAVVDVATPDDDDEDDED
jgi:hypothetical protein